MTYTIIEKTIITRVKYDFNGVEVICDVNHYMPNGDSDIEKNIINRGQTEELLLNNQIPE